MEAKNKERIIKIIEHTFNEIKPDIMMAGLVGSGQSTKIHGDFDIFIVLGETEDARKNFARHKQVLQIFDRIRYKLNEENISISVFTEFRMEEFSRYLLKNTKQNQCLFHLKIYPTLESISYWQANSVAKGYFSNIKQVFYEHDNFGEKLANYVNGFPVPDSKKRYEFLRSLAYETYEYLILSNLPTDYLLIEGLNKLYYIVKYVSLELLNCKEYSKLNLGWQDVLNRKNSLPSQISKCIDFLSINLERENFQFSLEDLTNLFELMIFAIEKELQKELSNGNEKP